jgi:transposase-like protein
MTKRITDKRDIGGSNLSGKQRSEGERSEPEWSGVPDKLAADQRGYVLPNPEVTEKGTRRRFTAAYKSDIVRQALACREFGEIGALLRREGLYSSQLSKWRVRYELGASQALADDTRGRKSTRNPLDDEVQRLRKQNTRLEHRLKQAEAIIEIQKKVSEILGIPLASIDEDERGR